MSLASVYAAGLATSDAGKAVIVAAKPASFRGSDWTAEVTDLGRLHITQTTTSDFEIAGDTAVQFASWINTTFGGL